MNVSVEHETTPKDSFSLIIGVEGPQLGMQITPYNTCA